MKVTLITATYNSESTIKDCLQSVAQQTYPNIEHIIVDGASRDATISIVKSFQNIEKYISEPDKGIYDALNKGLQMSTGDIIGFLHSDDCFESKDTIEKIVAVFQKNNSIDGIYGDLDFVSQKDMNVIVRKWKSSSQKNVKYGWMPPHPTLFLTKKIYEKYQGFDTSFRIAGDYDFILRILKDNHLKLSYLPVVITKMRIGGVSTGKVKALRQKSREDIKALKNNKFQYPYFILLLKILQKLPQLFVK